MTAVVLTETSGVCSGFHLLLGLTHGHPGLEGLYDRV